MSSAEVQLIVDWIKYNIDWVHQHYGVLLAAWFCIVGAFSHLAAIVPSKGATGVVKFIDGFINTDKIHKLIDTLALNVANAANGAKVKQTADAPKALITETPKP